MWRPCTLVDGPPRQEAEEQLELDDADIVRPKKEDRRDRHEWLRLAPRPNARHGMAPIASAAPAPSASRRSQSAAKALLEERGSTASAEEPGDDQAGSEEGAGRSISRRKPSAAARQDGQPELASSPPSDTETRGETARSEGIHPEHADDLSRMMQIAKGARPRRRRSRSDAATKDQVSGRVTGRTRDRTAEATSDDRRHHSSRPRRNSATDSRGRLRARLKRHAEGLGDCLRLRHLRRSGSPRAEAGSASSRRRRSVRARRASSSPRASTL